MCAWVFRRDLQILLEFPRSIRQETRKNDRIFINRPVSFPAEPKRANGKVRLIRAKVRPGRRNRAGSYRRFGEGYPRRGDREGRPYAKREKIHDNEKPPGFWPEGFFCGGEPPKTNCDRCNGNRSMVRGVVPTRTFGRTGRTLLFYHFGLSGKRQGPVCKISVIFPGFLPDTS